MKEEQEQEKKSKQTGVLHPVSQCGYIRAIHILSSCITQQEEEEEKKKEK